MTLGIELRFLVLGIFNNDAEMVVRDENKLMWVLVLVLPKVILCILILECETQIDETKMMQVRIKLIFPVGLSQII